jgi:tRNA(adenine34) deaminase
MAKRGQSSREYAVAQLDYNIYLTHCHWMEFAFKLAQTAGDLAEILAIRTATKKRQSFYLEDCTLYVTLEPCPMCAGAIIHARLGLLVYGADDPKTGAIHTVANLPDSYCSNHRLKVLAGIKETSCRQQLQTWFSHQR